MKIIYEYHDGGRKLAGFKGHTSDCVCRAFSIADQKDYKEVYLELRKFCKNHRVKGSSPRTGVSESVVNDYFNSKGYFYMPLHKKGNRYWKMYELLLYCFEQPIIMNMRSHVACLFNGIYYDTYAVSNYENKTVYGYWKKV